MCFVIVCLCLWCKPFLLCDLLSGACCLVMRYVFAVRPMNVLWRGVCLQGVLFCGVLCFYGAICCCGAPSDALFFAV